jgi:membrane carboxypeptidase/penicillin-binding protein PbpC
VETGEKFRIGGSTISMQEAVLATPVYAKPLGLLNRLTVEQEFKESQGKIH